MAKVVLLVINPKSGDGIAMRWVTEMVSSLSEIYDYVTVYFSKSSGDITNVLRSSAGKVDAFVVVGGDGSLNEALTGIALSGVSTPLGYIPTGTVNDFATSHGIPKNIKQALDKLRRGTPKKCDIGRINDKFFSYVAAFGAFTDVAYLTSQKSKEDFGKIAYVAEGAKRIFELKPIKMTYTVGGVSKHGEYIYGMASNAKTIGGIRFFDSGRTDFLCDGEIDVTLVKYPYTPAELSSALWGLINPAASCSQIEKFSAKSVTFDFENETPFTVDGEFAGTFKRAEIDTLCRALSLIE